jgi:hypothetical protein
MFNIYAFSVISFAGAEQAVSGGGGTPGGFVAYLRKVI